MAKRLLVAGGSSIDFMLSTPYIPAPDETLQSSGKYAFIPSGKGANTAVAAKSFGAEVVFMLFGIRSGKRQACLCL